MISDINAKISYTSMYFVHPILAFLVGIIDEFKVYSFLRLDSNCIT